MRKDLSINKIIFILFFALILRVGFIIGLNNQPPTTHDGLVFDDVAMNVIEKGRFEIGPTSPERRVVFYDVKDGFSWKEPLYPFFLVSVYKIFGHSFIAVRLIEAIIGVFTVFLVYIIGLRFFSMTIALLASLLIAAYPPFINFTGLFMRETLLVFLTSVLTFYLIKIPDTEQVPYRDYLIIGALLGVIALLKAAIIVFAPFLILAFLFKYKTRMKSFIKISAVTFLMMVLVVLPWTVRNLIVHHKFVLITTSGGINFLIGNNPKAAGTNKPWPIFSPEQEEALKKLSEADMDRQYFKWGLRYIYQDPLRYLKLAFKKFFIFWFDSYGSYKTPYGFITRIFDVFLLIFGFLGILYSFTAATWRKYLMVNLFIISITLAHMIFFVVIRNRFPIIPLLSLFAAFGLISFISSFKNLGSIIFKERRRSIIIKFLATAAVGLGYVSYHILRLINKFNF